ncbi:MAG: glycosyltransferase, partial [Deltaproteobacteria bacterium]|nr:glycosyltransferase [Deltaproteobacteria bacterium]
MNNPRISVIIPAFNEGQVIRDVINMVSSLYPDAEIIVINDGST